MAVDISNGGLTFKSDLDPTGFASGAEVIKRKEAEIRKGIAEGAKQQQVFSDEMLRAATMARHTSDIKIKAAIENTNAFKAEGLSIKQLNEELRKQQLLAQSTGDPAKIARLNKIVQETQGEINRLSNVGKVGFDDLGNKVEQTAKKTSGFKGALNGVWGGLKTVANILPGLGIAGLLAFAIEPITSYLASLDLFSKKIAQAVKDKKAFAETMLEGAKNAQSEQVQLDTLYKSATNTNIPLKERNKIADELQSKYPSYFANLSNEEILAGKAANAYKSLSEQILAAAQARAAQDKISENAKRILENDERIAETGKSLLKEQEKLRRAKSYENEVSTVSAGYGSNTNMVSVGSQIAIRSNIKKIQKTISDAQKDTEILTNRNKILSEKIQANIAEKGASVITGLKTQTGQNKSATDDFDKLLKSRTEAMKKLDELRAKNALPLEGEDSEAARIRKGFEEVRRIIAEENEKIIAENKKLKKKVPVLDISLVSVYEQEAYDNLLVKQQKEKDEAERKGQEEKYIKLLDDFMDYGQKREALTKQYEADALLLVNDARQLAERKKAYEKDLRELDDTNSKKLDGYEILFAGIENLSKKSALKVLANARAQLSKDIKSGAIIDPAEIAKVKKYFDEVETTINNGSGQSLIELANKVDGVANAVKGIDEAFGKVLSTLGNVLGQVGNIKKGMADFKAAGSKGDLFGQLGAGLGMVGAGISIFQSVFSLFDRSAEKRQQEEYKADLQTKQMEALNKALERQISLMDNLYGTDRIKEYSAAIKTARENEEKHKQQLAGRYSNIGNKAVDGLISQINSGKTTGYGAEQTIVNEILKGRFNNQLPTDIASLQKLLDEGRLDANTAKIVENLIKAKETAQQLLNNLNAEKVGSSLEQMADDFISTLTDGAQDFGKTFEQTIQKSILNGFKGEMIRKQLQAFYSQFAELAGGGLTKDEIEILRNSYLEASEKAKRDIADLEKATGISFGDTDGGKKQGELSKGIQGVTETTANRLEAEFAGLRLAQLQLVAQSQTNHSQLMVMNTQKLNTLIAIERNTGRTAENTNRLASIENSLSSIDKKTTDASAKLRGGGII